MTAASCFCPATIQSDRQTLFSGPFARLFVIADVSDATCWPALASGSSYAPRLQYDLILLVNVPSIMDSWYETVSDMTDGYAMIAI
jgi:hypothetical protein